MHVCTGVCMCVWVLFCWCKWVYTFNYATMLVDVCQCCCLLMFGCLLLSRHFPCCKTCWIKNLNLNSHRNVGKKKIKKKLQCETKKQNRKKERKKERKNKWREKSISILISVPFLFFCFLFFVCVYVCVCSAFLFVCIIPCVNCFGRTMLYMYTEYYI